MEDFLIDTHCHLDFECFDADRHQILANCSAKGISAIVVPGVSAANWERVISTCKNDMLLPALGLHPCYVENHRQEDLSKLREFSGHRELHAIGEIGLDYYLRDLDRDKQRDIFNEQLKIAAEFSLPVLIHARKSHHDIIAFLKQTPGLRGIIHAFSGSREQALEYLKLGFKLGFGGAYTYQGATRLRKLVKTLPTEAWVLETDAPDMSPALHQHQRNSPEYLTEILASLIELSGVEKEMLIEQLFRNTLEIFPALGEQLCRVD